MHRLLLTFVAVIAILASPAFGRDEPTALAEFKKDVAALKTWADERAKKNIDKNTDPLGPLMAVREIVEKFKAINTEGLPADVKEPWTAAVVGFTKVVALVDQLPKDPAEATKKIADPTFQKEFMTQMTAIQQEMAPTFAKLKEAAKKYGIEGLEKIH